MPSIYDDIGGSEAVTVAVDDLYERILSDHELAPYFARRPRMIGGSGPN